MSLARWQCVLSAFIFTLVLIAPSSDVAAQGQMDTSPEIEVDPTIRAIVEDAANTQAASSTGTIAADTEAVSQARADALVRKYEYAKSSFDHRRALFDWQLWSGYFIFAIVVIIVFVGLYFSWLQFSDTRRHLLLSRKRAAAGKVVSSADLDTQSLQSSVEAGPDGIKVSSPVLGVIILMISVAFFYLYLVHVYPITAVESVIDTSVSLPD